MCFASLSKCHYAGNVSGKTIWRGLDGYNKFAVKCLASVDLECNFAKMQIKNVSELSHGLNK